jgi:hypothetical protein
LSEQEPGTELVLPHSFELINLEDERAITAAYRELSELKGKVVQAERILREAIAAQASRRGTKTFHVEGVGKVEVKGGEKVEYLADVVEQGLRELDCPEEVIREIVIETVSHRVDGHRARRAAAANPEYAKVIEKARIVREQIPSVLIT